MRLPCPDAVLPARRADSCGRCGEFVRPSAEPVDAACASDIVVVDGSLFRARGPVWHQTDRAQGRVPEKRRNLDRDASWG